jgi:hypothetical protein
VTFDVLPYQVIIVPFDGPDDYDLTHGRELAVYPDRVLHIFCFRILARMALL